MREATAHPGTLLATALSSLLLLIGCLGAQDALARKKKEPEPRLIIVEIDCIADPAFLPDGKSYYFESAMDNLGSEDLEFREVAGWLGAATRHPIAETRESADVLVRVSFGIGDPQTTRSTVVTAPGYSYPIGSYWYSAPPLTETYVNTTYTRRLVVEAYDLKVPGRLPQVWKTSLKSVGTMGDLRYILPFMVAVGGEYYGRNVGHDVRNVPDDAAGRAIVESWTGPVHWPAATPQR